MRRQVQYSGDSEAVGYDSKVIIVTHEYENNEVVTYVCVTSSDSDQILRVQ